MRQMIPSAVVPILAQVRRLKSNRCAECGEPLAVSPRGFIVPRMVCRECYGVTHYAVDGPRVTDIGSGAYMPGGAMLVEN